MIAKRFALGYMLSTAILLVATPKSANADVLWCYTKITSVAVRTNGWLYLNFENMGQVPLCDVNADLTPADPSIGTIKADVCKSWYASALSHMNTQKTVVMAIAFPGTAPACNAIPGFSWAFPNPYPYWIEFMR